MFSLTTLETEILGAGLQHTDHAVLSFLLQGWLLGCVSRGVLSGAEHLTGTLTGGGAHISSQGTSIIREFYHCLLLIAQQRGYRQGVGASLRDSQLYLVFTSNSLFRGGRLALLSSFILPKSAANGINFGCWYSKSKLLRLKKPFFLNLFFLLGDSKLLF